jgi:predicted enzyme related to lactoylglutathione lyase
VTSDPWHVHFERRGRPAAVARRLSEPSRISWRRMTTVKICIDVADLDEAGAFYCQALQCTEVGRNSRTVKLTAGGNELYLILRPEGSMPFLAATEGRSFARHWTPVHLDFSVEDVGRSTSEITRLGGIVEGQESGDWGSLTRCADPFGNGFCLVTT